MPANARGRAAESTRDEQESLLPELLHALNQPLTALRCSLEMTLLQPRDSEEYRKRLRESLRLAEEITTLAGGIREMVEAERPSEHSQRVDVSALLGTTVREFLPVAASTGVSLSLLCVPSLATRGDPYQFSKAFLYLLDFILSHSSKGDELTIQASRDGAEIDVALELTKRRALVAAIRAGKSTAKTYLAFLIARRIIEVEGGTVRLEREGTQVSLQIRMQQDPPPGEAGAEPRGASPGILEKA